MRNNQLDEDLTGDLAAAVRRSWSESQNSTGRLQREVSSTSILGDSGHSPISTPIPEPIYENDDDSSASIHRFNASYTQSISSTTSENNSDSIKQQSQHSQQQDTPVLMNTFSGQVPYNNLQRQHQQNNPHMHTREPDYQLFKHHYSISEDHRDSVVEILNDLELESPEPETLPQNVSPNLPSQQQHHPIHGIISREPRTSISKQSTTTRRSSIQDVQWVRQLLNPRSSFSGKSINEPPNNQINVSSNITRSGSVPYNIPTDNKCWVTILVNDSIEAIKSIVVLSESVRLSRSMYPLYVIHDNKINMSKLNSYNIASIPISLDDFKDLPKNNENNTNWLILSLFINLVDHFDVVCYISPTCMIIENIDELLSCEEVCNEIDNETCVLLTNATKDINEQPQLMILKPNQEVSMCIKEYFTLYGNDNKLEKLSKMNDFDVLKELFHDTWGHILSDGYISVLLQDIDIRINQQQISKIADFKFLQPWNNKNYNDNNNNDTLCGKWCKIWEDFCKNVK